ncbi:hypothetical protein JRQ81_004022 [Phrynocephalus forsythii]|uniref:Uncharacterized protein n=1 Tax=Phrynocephalus forsythii TaxID=171643 RepID=A0A9Q0XMU8_9SAUR|nr:hypothetical protein JRQ81_004022 [Phrynocephalus forsythii]
MSSSFSRQKLERGTAFRSECLLVAQMQKKGLAPDCQLMSTELAAEGGNYTLKCTKREASGSKQPPIETAKGTKYQEVTTRAIKSPMFKGMRSRNGGLDLFWDCSDYGVMAPKKAAEAGKRKRELILLEIKKEMIWKYERKACV